MNLKPIGDRIIVEPIDEESTTASGIVVPDTAKEKPQKGKVVAVGSGKYVDDELVPLEVKVDDTILFARYSPTEIKIEGKEYFILKEEDVLAVVEGGK